MEFVFRRNSKGNGIAFGLISSFKVLGELRMKKKENNNPHTPKNLIDRGRVSGWKWKELQ
jgi:hypothetical protein